MIIHNLKVAIRSLLANKNQTIISIIGLAIGFVCFALSALWLRYENSYDAFHEGADRIYMIKTHSRDHTISVENVNQLKEKYPEIEETAIALKAVYEDNQKRKLTALLVDRGFFSFFPLTFKAGNKELFFTSPRHALVNQSSIKKLYGEDTPLGKQIIIERNKMLFLYPDWGNIPGNDPAGYSVMAITAPWQGHSDLQFDYLLPFLGDNTTYVNGFIKLKQGVDKEAVVKKIAQRDKQNVVELLPLLSIHTSEDIGYAQPGNLTTSQVLLFLIASSITILCFLLNYISLFISKLQYQLRSLALRRMLGSSFFRLYFLLITEILVLLFIAALLGLVIIEWLMPAFISYANIQHDSSGFWAEIAFYIAIAIGVSLLLAVIPLYQLRKVTLQTMFKTASYHKPGSIGLANMLLWFQLFIGMLLLYCTVIFVRQIEHLNRVDMGIDREGLCFVEIKNGSPYDFNTKFTTLINQVQNLPEIEAVAGHITGRIGGLCEWDQFQSLGKDTTDKITSQVFIRVVSSGYYKVCGMKYIQGEWFKNTDEEWNRDKIVLDKMTAKLLFGTENPIGEKVQDILGTIGIPLTVIGVVQNVYEFTSRATQPHVYVCSPMKDTGLVYRFKNGMRIASEKKICALFAEHNTTDELEFFYMEDLVAQQNKTEINFLKLLYLLSVVCISGALFGIYAMVSQACLRRRKEIAIRKINGGNIGVLIHLFLKRYLWLLIAASLIAYPVGYLLMSSWMEQFVLRATLPYWIYPLLFLIVALLLFGVVILRIWHSVHINPAEEIRKE